MTHHSITGLLRSGALAIALAATGTVAFAPFTAEPAFAQGNSGGKGNGNGGNGGNGRNAERDGGSETTARGNGNGNRGNGGMGRGALASELKGLNAAHASPQALANASPDSMPGKLAILRDELLAYRADPAVPDATLARDTAQDALDAYLADGLDELEPDSTEYLEAEAALKADPQYTTLVADLAAAQGTLDDLGAAYSDAYLALTGGVVLSAEATAELYRLLGI